MNQNTKARITCKQADTAPSLRPEILVDGLFNTTYLYSHKNCLHQVVLTSFIYTTA